ncbi:hypothetical protein G4V62_02955 [Bacillaceae bacterium SIJ1]|uniref:hypothetical protein n=1 Tax=Litoribacterium kuwaitense TaxID=1398745 RepID=UPI0013EA3AB3|nr:hypothetical protein [Litoribacterium kuwaitense]NGP43958.1 hypothetical protein [Litoribacterium kuwaitense]
MSQAKKDSLFRTTVDHHSMIDVLREAYQKAETSEAMTVEELVRVMIGELQPLLISERQTND